MINIMKKFFFLLLTVLFIAGPVLAYDPWPGGSAADITAGINAVYSGFEPSGAIWHPGLNSFFVNGDDGDLFEINSTGTVSDNWWIGGDLEGMTYIDSSSSVVYFLNEDTSTIFGFDLAASGGTGAVNGESWNFYGADEPNGLLYENSGGEGVEGLTWIPDGYHPFGTTTMGGVFAVGYQQDGDIYFYEPTSSTTYSFLYELHTPSGSHDLAGLNFDPVTHRMFAVYDSSDLMEEYECSTSGFVLKESYSLSGGYAEEGVAFKSDCSSGLAEVLIADDGHNTSDIGHVFIYENFSITCPATTPTVIDVDGDGYDSTVDCNDADPLVYTTINYYLDADGDGLGSTTVAAFCSATAPAGYVSNYSDTNDSIPNAGVEISGDRNDNDGDGVRDEYNTITENSEHPYYSTLDPSDITIYGSKIITASGLRSGYISVRYGDNSVYYYQVYSTSSATKPTVINISGSGYFGVLRGREAALINGLTGEIIASTTLTKATARALSTWLASLSY